MTRVRPQRIAHRWSPVLADAKERRQDREFSELAMAEAHTDMDRYTMFLEVAQYGIWARTRKTQNAGYYQLVKEHTGRFHTRYGKFTDQELHRLRMALRFNNLAYL
jgi:hypothetical protein